MTVEEFLRNKCQPAPPPPDLGLTTDCQECKGFREKRGYVRIEIEGKRWFAHRFSYTISRGPIPDGLQVQHRCNRGWCCEPTHLKVGTHQENMNYMCECGRSATGDRHNSRTHPESVARGDRNGAHTHPECRPRGERNGQHTKPECTARGERHGRHTKPEATARGERNGNSKLTAHQVMTIRERCASGETHRAVARDFGVHQTLISGIMRGERWKHLLEEVG